MPTQSVTRRQAPTAFAPGAKFAGERVSSRRQQIRASRSARRAQVRALESANEGAVSERLVQRTLGQVVDEISTDLEEARTEVTQQFTTQMTLVSVSVLLAVVLMHHGAVARAPAYSTGGALLIGGAMVYGMVARLRLFVTSRALLLRDGLDAAAADRQARSEVARIVNGTERTMP